MSATGYLFLTPSVQRTRANYRGHVRALKEKHGIHTHHASMTGDWIAISMPTCIKALEGYGLTAEEKTSIGALFAGYCRLLDEAGLVEEGHQTEREAVEAAVRRWPATKEANP
jgi:hypothetical protein